ncbi:MAG TPA: hypothetical protein VFA30_08610 [Gaiellaceae bacterium]|nr:hypothetical protein [Gaiellaceae bacterium]
MTALAALAVSVVLQAGQVQWFLPGVLPPGTEVRCSVAGRVVSASVPRTAMGRDAFTRGVQMSIQRATNGAVEAACNTQLAESRPSRLPYVIGQNGVALIRGANRLSQLEQRYGRPTGTREIGGGCTVAWSQSALQATFTRCSARGVLVSATATSTRWSSLTGVHVGDSLARLRFEAPSAKREGAGRWRLAGAHGHALVARVAGGRVTGLVATLG